ncbi:hypothetical protein BJX76DRAFT_332479 [Aspergillus varians]
MLFLYAFCLYFYTVFIILNCLPLALHLRPLKPELLTWPSSVISGGLIYRSKRTPYTLLTTFTVYYCRILGCRLSLNGPELVINLPAINLFA